MPFDFNSSIFEKNTLNEKSNFLLTIQIQIQIQLKRNGIQISI
jgi:hypothetical protein